MSTVSTILISQDLLTKYSPIGLTVSDTKVIPSIIRAQVDIRTIIGSELYNVLVQEVSSKEQDPTYIIPQKYLDLLEVIAPALAYRSLYYAISYLWVSISQKGIIKESSENSQSISQNELAFLRSDLSESWCSFQSILLEFLSTNQADYPEYKTPVPISEPRSEILF